MRRPAPGRGRTEGEGWATRPGSRSSGPETSDARWRWGWRPPVPSARGEIILTRRKAERLDDLAGQGYQTQSDNRDAVRRADVVVAAVEPKQLDGVLDEIAPDLDPKRHMLISVVSGASIADMVKRLGKEMTVVRAMPNTGIALARSMTCIAMNSTDEEARKQVTGIFDAVGITMFIDEEQMVPATALCACGIAFFLRAVRAASQGGIEIGFHPDVRR